MSPYKTHLSVLQHAAAAYASTPALKVPAWSAHDQTFQGWADITFSQFLKDVEQSARYWSQELSKLGLEGPSVVGLWLKGMSYLDAVHIWGMSRAGFIPQLVSLGLTSPAVVRELLTQGKAKALILDPSFEPSLGDELPSFPAVDPRSLDLGHSLLPDPCIPSTGDEIMIIFHSSGSTLGKPKLVPLSARWLDCNIRKGRHFTVHTPTFNGQEIVTSGGSFCHIAATLSLVSFIDRGGCMVLPTKVPYSQQELQMMVEKCGINLLNMFSSFLGGLIRESRKDPKLLATLQSFSGCSHGGLPLESDDEIWALQQGIRLINLFASTEVGCMMISKGDHGPESRYLQPFPGTSYKFVPIPTSPTANGRIVELIITRESADCPHYTLRDEPDGDFATGDLFEEVVPGRYVSRGRNDDWIKMDISLRCDTRSIEDNAMQVCAADLISAAVVVGRGRPSPALFVEPHKYIKQDLLQDASALKSEILGRIAPFHERRYTHERIDDDRLIIVVPKMSLPRTGKGTIQRKLVENGFQEELDQIYSAVYDR